jgi:4'-phosphopantetheinyl transferase
MSTQSPSPLDAPSRQVDLWLACPDEIGGAELLGGYRELLADEERARERRFHFKTDSHNYLVAHAMLRTVLSKYAPVAPRDWVLRANAYGRPELANARLAPAMLSFNLSRSKGLVACAVARGAVVGMDVENMGRRVPAGEDIAKRFFSAREAADLERLPQALRGERFFHYWTLKEAYIKARGMGLSIGLDRFSFELAQDDAIGLTVDAQLADPAQRWRCWLLQPDQEHLAAVCVERVAGQIQEPRVRKIVPLVSDEPYPCAVLRRSID